MNIVGLIISLIIGYFIKRFFKEVMSESKKTSASKTSAQLRNKSNTPKRNYTAQNWDSPLKPLTPHIPKSEKQKESTQVQNNKTNTIDIPHTEPVPVPEQHPEPAEFSFTVEEYWKEAFKERNFEDPMYYEEPWFLSNFPDHTIGQCPFCSKKTKVKIDNATLSRSHFDRSKGHAGLTLYPDISTHTLEESWYNTCEHLFLVDGFLNFQDNYPSEIPKELRTGYENVRTFSSEIPGLIKPYMDARSPELDIRAVMSSVSWHGIEGAAFVPRHTAYFICYYIPDKNQSLSPLETFRQLNNYEEENWLIDDLDFDLLKFVKRGDLYWLDNGLRGKEDLEHRNFPYQRISGLRNLNFLIDPALI